MAVGLYMMIYFKTWEWSIVVFIILTSIWAIVSHILAKFLMPDNMILRSTFKTPSFLKFFSRATSSIWSTSNGPQTWQVEMMIDFKDYEAKSKMVKKKGFWTYFWQLYQLIHLYIDSLLVVWCIWNGLGPVGVKYILMASWNLLDNATHISGICKYNFNNLIANMLNKTKGLLLFICKLNKHMWGIKNHIIPLSIRQMSSDRL